MTFLIPCAGLGARFHSTIPKPLIQVLDGRPMLELVLENLRQQEDHRFVCCILKEHELKFNLSAEIKKFAPYVEICIIEKLSDGPASTCYEAKGLVDQDDELIIINCDQIIEDFDIQAFLRFCHRHDHDGVLGTFFSRSPKNSYVKLNDSGLVVEAQEKKVLSEYATNGLHYWKRARYFFDSYVSMVKKNARTLNEFYVAPSYNYLINDGKKIGAYFFNEHYPIGIPSDLDYYKNLKIK
jgi:NDP-sugar pyrophosphorylase family protein